MQSFYSNLLFQKCLLPDSSVLVPQASPTSAPPAAPRRRGRPPLVRRAGEIHGINLEYDFL